MRPAGTLSRGETSTDNGAGKRWCWLWWRYPTCTQWSSARDHRAEMAGTLNQRGGGRGKPGRTVENENDSPCPTSLPFLVLGLSARPAISKCLSPQGPPKEDEKPSR
ncbi:hypothetical protein CMUS01_03315 [Colletotrichum musicola]|uniref:Uncharacterized protein n=1 Tax=Colletotrichum musicola TaxID=2175873 RepID=A0A8H6U6Y9_9PEZI|nr:hypothetical protein CMUS01_03315 [Colletotrichum musicola]